LSLPPPFWLDTNVFVEAKNRWYRFEIFPKFWDFLSEEIDNGSICSPKFVYDEIMKGKDKLTEWIRVRKNKGVCISADANVQLEYRKIAAHVLAKYPRNQYEEFLAGADGWLIATAIRFGGTVVTQESHSRKKKIRIPTICAAFNVQNTDIPGLLDHFKPKF
jgi:predicted nucleic acid-binding protein